MIDKEIIKNAHCKYFEGQTGLCQAKEFKRCNPINCKLYTIDELSTILDLQKQLRHKEQECEALQLSENEAKEIFAELNQKLKYATAKYNTVLEQNKALQAEIKGKTQECEELKKVKEDAKIAFQILWNQTHTKTGWSPHIFAQNMLLKFFGGMDAFNEVKKKRKDFLNTVQFRGEALDLFVTELEQELMNYKQKCIDLEDKNEYLKERLEIICEEIAKEKVNEK